MALGQLTRWTNGVLPELADSGSVLHVAGVIAHPSFLWNQSTELG
jgi:hypothetical protein